MKLAVSLFFLMLLLAAYADPQTHTFPARDTNNVFTVTNSIALPCNIGGVLYVAAGCFSGSDIGAQINSAYSVVSNGGKIIVPPLSSGCYNFTTPIVMKTVGKVVTLEGAPAGWNGTTTPNGGTCLNFTPTSGTALLIDFVPVQSPLNGSYGLKNITLINNGCVTSGGCGGTAIGLDISTTNTGLNGGVLENVGIWGFAIGHRNLNAFCSYTWTNPQFFANVVAFKFANINAAYIFGGDFGGNQTVFQANTTTSAGVIYVYGAQFFSNSTLTFDYTAVTTTPGTLHCFACHFEAAGAVQLNAVHYIQGNVDVYLSGGIAEDDSSGGTRDWFFNTSGNVFVSEGVQYVTRGTLTQILVANSPVRGTLGGYLTAGTFMNYVTGANAAKVSVRSLFPPGGSSPVPDQFENNVGIGGVITNFAGTSTMGSTLKKGSGSGNYTNATTSYTVADNTNLCDTVTIPTGWKLIVTASGNLGTSTAIVFASVALTDNASCSTANSGILVENQATGQAIAAGQPFALNWVVTGDGNSHNIALQFRTSNASDAAFLLNSSATLTPTMTFTLMPSN